MDTLPPSSPAPTPHPPDNAPAPPYRRPGWRKWAKRLALGTLLLLVGYACWIIGEREWVKVSGQRELATARVEIDAADPDWHWEALLASRQKPPEDCNGVELARRIKPLLPDEWSNHPSEEEWLKSAQSVPANTAFPPELMGIVRGKLAAVGPALKLARQFRNCPTGYREIELTPAMLGSSGEPTIALDEARILLGWDCITALADQANEQAVEDLIAMLNVSRAVGQEPLLLAQSYRCKSRTIATVHLQRLLSMTERPPGLDKLQAAWVAEANEPLLLFGIRGDRAFNSMILDKVYSGELAGKDVARAIGQNELTISDRFAMWQERAWIPRAQAHFLRWMTAAAAAARLPIEQQPAAFAALPKLPISREYNVSTSRGLAVLSHADRFWRSVAYMRCAIVGIAAERFRQQFGRWPVELSELSPRIIAAVPLNPFGGVPLTYNRDEEGILISVSRRTDLIDFFQAINTDDEQQLQTEVVAAFRVWNPHQRRKPAAQPGDGDAIPPPREVKP